MEDRKVAKRLHRRNIIYGILSALLMIIALVLPSIPK